MKRIFDTISALTGLIILSPVLLVTAILVRIKLGSPVLFRQQRPGLNAQPFYVYKFRTMTEQRDSDGQLLPDEMRLTPFGKFLRRLSLDELPQLLNVVKGDLSLVGPRPLLMQYLPLYTHEQARRHEVRPGITGWAQVNGRNAIGWEDKFRLDVWYVDHHSFWLDLKILWMTFNKVFRREGISQEGQATMEKFKGSHTESGNSEKEKIFVFGASGHAKVVIDIIEQQGLYDIAFLIDDDISLKNTHIYGYHVLGGKSDLLGESIRKGIVAIGSNKARRNVSSWLTNNGFELVSAIHPSAQLARGVTVGSGTVIMAGTIINSDSAIGYDAIINTNATIDHDCTIGDGAHIAPGATLCGTVAVGDGTFVCAGVTVIPNLNIGRDVTIGAGSTVIRHVPDNLTVVGSPAKTV